LGNAIWRGTCWTATNSGKISKREKWRGISIQILCHPVCTGSMVSSCS
jgi:hypothetical protein